MQFSSNHLQLQLDLAHAAALVLGAEAAPDGAPPLAGRLFSSLSLVSAPAYAAPASRPRKH